MSDNKKKYALPNTVTFSLCVPMEMYEQFLIAFEKSGIETRNAYIVEALKEKNERILKQKT